MGKRSWIVLFLIVFCWLATRFYSPVTVTDLAQQSLYIPNPYYENVARVYTGLENEVNNLEWQVEYKPDIFDCTEMSALLEYHLENKGYTTVICAGWYERDYHCWLEVEVVPNHFVVVEVTIPEVRTSTEDYRVQYRFKDIYEATKINYEAFDWWNNIQEAR